MKRWAYDKKRIVKWAKALEALDIDYVLTCIIANRHPGSSASEITGDKYADNIKNERIYTLEWENE